MESNYFKISKRLRQTIIDCAYNCGQSAHLGGALSIVDLLTVLYSDFLQFDANNPRWENRDIFILSKGHTVLAYLAALHEFGFIDTETLNTFQTNGSKLIAHPIKHLDYGIESSNGSLGQGISYACGMAIGFKKRSMKNKVFCILGDGECNEGSVWEAAQLASELCLDNLVVIIDQNGKRNDGDTSYGAHLNLEKMWRGFGWNTVPIDGHDFNEIAEAYQEAIKAQTRPYAIVANTVKGKGFSFMENNNDWHHNRITEKSYLECMKELELN